MAAFQLLGVEGNTWSPVRELSDDELASFKEASQHLNEFERSRSLIPLIERNEAEFKSELDRLMSTQAGLTHPGYSLQGKSEAMDAVSELNRRLVNYLTSFLVYLDHTRTRLVRRYGRDSTEFKTFEKWKKLAEENEFGYRFIRQLRNYVQHCGMPITHFVLAWNRKESHSGSTFHTEFELGFNAEVLLSGTSKWGPVKRDLKEIGGYFPPWEPVERATAALRQIDDNAVQAEIPALITSYKTIRAIVRDALQKGLMPFIGQLDNVDPDGEPLRMRGDFIQVPWRAMESLGLVEFNDGNITLY